MIKKMDAILHLHQDHAAAVYDRFDSLENRLNNIETRLAISDLGETNPEDN